MKKINKIIAFMLAFLIVFSVLFTVKVFADDEDTSMCAVTVQLTEMPNKKVDTVIYRFQNTEDRSYIDVEFKQSDNFKSTFDVPAGKYKISYQSSKNNMEPVLEVNTITVKSGLTSASAELKVEKVNNNSFWARFFRNNSFFLIALVVAVVVYLVLKKKREMAYINSGIDTAHN